MEQRTRQRLIGALLLALLAAILAPLLLRSPEEVRVALDLEIPREPEIASMPERPVVSEQEQEAVRERIRADRDQLREESRRYDEALEEGQEPAREEPPLSGWAVQLGSFGDRDNARALAEQLRDRGQNAFIREAEHDGESLFRVFAGPEIEREAARALRDRLAEDGEAGLEGLVVPLEP